MKATLPAKPSARARPAPPTAGKEPAAVSRLFASARFVLSATQPREFPPESAAEIAFVGRSNAGKSSALNTICQQKLAFVSKMPGRTQLVNFFALGDERTLVDLPGYGFASAPEATRSTWEAMVGGYLEHRQSLRAIVLIMDARHPLTALDGALLDLANACKKPVFTLLSKADKLSRSEAAQTKTRVERELSTACESLGVLLFSSLKRTGMEQARLKVAEILGVQ